MAAVSVLGEELEGQSVLAYATGGNIEFDDFAAHVAGPGYSAPSP